MSLTRLVAFLLVGWWVLTAYTFFHEGGHALAAWAFGGSLTSFDIDFWDFSAHSASAGTFNSVQQSILSISGMILPLALWVLGMALLPRKRPLLVDVLVITASSGVLATFLPWSVISILYAHGQAPPGDDVTLFLQFTTWNGYAASAGFMLLFTLGALFFWQRCGGRAALRRVFRQDWQGDGRWANQVTALVLLATWFAMILLADGNAPP
jgi:hypothetical protein